MNAFSHSGQFSLPYHEFFTHQNGKCGFDHAGALINIIHHSSFEATCLHCSMSSPYTTADSHKSLSLAILIESSILVDLIIFSTGQNVSCL
ncbi:MAG: hypothetical protein Q8S84_03770 [bacterium]|nr:hypothetical protein [bacterium]MDP3380639.1 hypothetical protein [bacterium]